MSIISEKYSFNVDTTVFGSIFSDIEVKPLISVNKTVASRSSPPKFKLDWLSKISSTTCLETYLLNVFLTLLTSEISSIAITKPSAFFFGPTRGAIEILITVSLDT